jgi:hypothetical protein
MPASDRPDAGAAPATKETSSRGGGATDVETQLEGLASAIDRLLAAYRELRERADQAVVTEQSLAEALEGADLEGLGSEEVALRLRELGEENRRLREAIDEGRERAERIRSRLILMEDEA